jgi:hypothetical protein
VVVADVAGVVRTDPASVVVVDGAEGAWFSSRIAFNASCVVLSLVIDRRCSRVAVAYPGGWYPPTADGGFRMSRSSAGYSRGSDTRWFSNLVSRLSWLRRIGAGGILRVSLVIAVMTGAGIMQVTSG